MKKFFLTIVTPVVSFFLMSFDTNENITKVAKLASCEDVVTSSIEMYENEYGCMDSDTYNSVYDSMMSSYC